MTSLIAVAVVLLMIAACLGYGAALLRALRVFPDLSVEERLGWGFTAGFAALGWLVFFPAWAGHATPAPFLAICAVGASLCFLVRGRASANGAMADPGPLPGVLIWLFAGAAIVIAGVDLLEGLAPPVDADSLAYHFNLPKRHLEAGGLVFIPRALDGSPPQLLHMTYMAALGLGGERAMTLWVMASGWASGVLVYVVARRWLGVGWSVALMLVYLSSPVVLQTGGTGHVEARLAPFALLGAIACGIAVRDNEPRYAAIAGLSAGAYAAGKMPGLLFLVACMLPLFFGRSRLRLLVVYGAAAVLAGFQWYLWSWMQSGDPLFPVLYAKIGVSDPSFWNDAQDRILQAWVPTEAKALPRNLWGFLLFPFYATFVNDPVIDAGRTGLGLFVVFAFPFALGAAWRYRHALRTGVLPVMALVVFLYALLHFFGGVPQRVRFFAPLYPVALICVSVAAARWAMQARATAPLVAGAGFCLALQLAGQLVFGIDFARHAASGESRNDFLTRTVSMAGMVPWLNDNLTRDDRVLVFNRQLLYLLDSSVEHTAPDFQARYNFVADRHRPAWLYRSLRKDGITHILFAGVRGGGGPDQAAWSAIDLWTSKKCVERVRSHPVTRLNSRTLKWANDEARTMHLFRLVADRCGDDDARQG